MPDSILQLNFSDTERRETLTFCFILIFGLFVVTPIIGILTRTFIPSIPRPIIIGVAIIAIGYVVLIIASRRLISGTFVAVIVLSTFSADIPLISVQYPGTAVGSLLLVEAPLLALLAILLITGTYERPKSPTGLLLLGFVGATVLSAFFGGGSDTTIALWFSVYAFAGWLTYWTTIQVFDHTDINLATTLEILSMTVLGHSLFAVVQFARGNTFGFSSLGEPAKNVTATIVLPVFGSVDIGTWTGGFAGMSFQLANLIVLVLPTILVLAFQSDVGRRAVLTGCALVMVVVLRISSSDAARGALVVALFAFGVYLAVVRLRTRQPIQQSKSGGERAMLNNGAIGQLITAIVAMIVLLYPSSDAGTSTSQPITPGNENETTTRTTSAPTGTPETTSGGGEPPASTTSGVQPSGDLSWIQDISIPLVDLSNLGNRIQQYLAGLDVFAHNPVFGVGGMNFVSIGSRYDIPSPPYSEFVYPIHNIYIILLAETGLLGFSLYLLALVGVFHDGLRGTLQESVNTQMVCAGLAGLTGVLAFGIFDHLQLYHVTGFFTIWIVAGGIVGESRTMTN